MFCPKCEKKNKVILLIIIGIIVVLIIAVISVLCVSKYTSNGKAENKSKKDVSIKSTDKDIEEAAADDDISLEEEMNLGLTVSPEEASLLLEQYIRNNLIIWDKDNNNILELIDHPNSWYGYAHSFAEASDEVGVSYRCVNNAFNEDGALYIQKDFDGDKIDELLVIDLFCENDSNKEVYKSDVGIWFKMYEVIDGEVQLASDKKITELNTEIMEYAEGEAKLFLLDDNSLFIERKYTLWGYGDEFVMDYANVSYNKKHEFTVDEVGSYTMSDGNDNGYIEGLNRIGASNVSMDDLLSGEYPDEYMDNTEFIFKFLTKYTYSIDRVMEQVNKGGGMRFVEILFLTENLEVPFMYSE